MTKTSTPQRVFLIFFFTLLFMVFLPYVFSAEYGGTFASIFTAIGFTGMLYNGLLLTSVEQEKEPVIYVTEDKDPDGYMSFDKSDYPE